MQPLAYFAMRALLGWLQFTERSKRAFMSNPLVLVAAGAAHCWAVVYALFVAIHTRAMRYDGYHEGYTEHLPFSVAWTETLATASLSIWWIAGFTTAAVRILDDDATDLPMEVGDTKSNMLTKIIRSPMLRNTLAAAHTVSCAGLFVSILLLCITMAAMSGTITVCELCLVVISAVFALPHAFIAARRIGSPAMNALPFEAAEAAGSEAAAIGPQLCVILALADTPGHAYMWQKLVYMAASICFMAAVAASGQSPPKKSGDALPPETLETWTCLALDVAACVCVLLCFPHLNTIGVWLLALLLILLAASVHMQEWRELYVDLLEPLFVVRSDAFKRLPGPTRQLLRKSSWFIALVCAITAVWDICLHPVQEELRYGAKHDDMLYLKDTDVVFNFRWKSSLEEAPSNEKILMTAASALQVESHLLRVQQTWPEHNLSIFKYTGPEHNTSQPTLLSRWISQIHTNSDLREVIDSSFAAHTDAKACSFLTGASGNSEPTIPSAVAMLKACDWSKENFAWDDATRI